MSLDIDLTSVDRVRLQKGLEASDRLINNRLLRWQRQSVAARLLRDERVSKCYRVRVQEFVSVLLSKKFKRAHYGGLSTCGSVWSCPVCASKITERRRVDLQQAVDRALEMGMSVFMVTWTMQHHKEDTLNDVRAALTSAMRSLKAGRFYQGFIDDFSIVGNVTSSEVKYGSLHGWHFHRHSIFFSTKKISEYECVKMQAQLSFQYKKKLEKLGRYADSVVGVDVRVGDRHISDYVSKYGTEQSSSNWSLSAEITKGGSKSGSALDADDHFIPFELLDLYRHEKDFRAGDLYCEYARTMKGYNQLRWSDGLRELFSLGAEMTDEEISSAQDDDASVFAQVAKSRWSKVLKKEARGQLLEVASTGNYEHFDIYLRTLTGQ